MDGKENIFETEKVMKTLLIKTRAMPLKCCLEDNLYPRSDCV